MTIKRKGRSFSESNSALSDLAFLLIIYFIVIAGFNVNRGYLMNLPAKDSTRLLLKEDILRYELDGSGKLLSGGKIRGVAEAEREIASAVKKRPNMAVVLSVSAKAPWQSVVAFVEIAKKLSVSSFSFKMMEDGE
jgi:biopolymer transport protein ExbD